MWMMGKWMELGPERQPKKQVMDGSMKYLHSPYILHSRWKYSMGLFPPPAPPC